MINPRVTRFCCEDISLIENYSLAINDIQNVWECHHKRELISTGSDKDYSCNDLKALNLYYKRPACELIFLLKSEHSKLHRNSSLEKGVVAKIIRERNKNLSKEEIKEKYNRYKNLPIEKKESISVILSNLSKGKKYWNNGVINKRSNVCPGKDWVMGRLPFKRNVNQSGSNNSNAKKLLDTRDNAVYTTRKEFVLKYHLSNYSFTKLLQNEVVKYL